MEPYGYFFRLVNNTILLHGRDDETITIPFTFMHDNIGRTT